MVVAREPILTEALEVEAQKVRSQIGRLTFGRKQGKPSITGQQVTSGFALGRRPADPNIPRTQMESGAGPTEQGDPLPVLFGHVAQ